MTIDSILCLTFAMQLWAMKKLHIVLLVLIVAAIAVLISFMPSGGGLTTFTTYESISDAKNMQGKTVHIVAKLDKSKPIEYDQVNNPNYLSFTAVDSLGGTVKVIYNNAKPDNLEHSERLVMKGKMVGDQFECNNIMMKCPSKYSDDAARIQESVNEKTK